MVTCCTEDSRRKAQNADRLWKEDAAIYAISRNKGIVVLEDNPTSANNFNCKGFALYREICRNVKWANKGNGARRGVPSKRKSAAQEVKNYVQKWKRRLRYAKGDSINLNGKEFVWDNKTRRYGYWLSAKNGKHYFKPMKREEYAQMVAIGVEKFFGSPKMLKKRAPESEIRAEMLQEERRWLVPLYSLGRQILPDIPLTNHVTLIDEHKMPNRANGRCSIDLVKNGLIVQRRFFDSNGNIEQDVDYDHPDSQKNHDKPHIHVWIGKNRSLQIKYRDENGVVKEEFTRMRYKKQFYNDEYDPILAVFAFDRKRRGKNEDYDANLLSFLD